MAKNNTKKELQKQIAYLEFINDQLGTEISYVDSILRLVGFADGLHTVKTAAVSLLNQSEQERPNQAA